MDFSDLPARLAGNPGLAIPLVFLGGVLTSFTPCIYPMIPITAAIVGGQTAGGPKQSRARTVGLTLSYVLGLALVYAALGLIAGLTGTIFGAISTNPWLYFGMANLLLVAGLAMLDAVPVRLPSSLVARAASLDTRGRYAGAFGMGAASGAVAAPCSAPVMATVLSFVTRTHSAGLGFIYLFVFSLGMSALLVAVGLVSGTASALPKAGAWMLWVKRLFAVVMFLAAEYYLVKMGQLIV
ncbi:MAG: cytochrome c biogenesis protein CcdA [Gemmatimonadaceae bacterium]